MGLAVRSLKSHYKIRHGIGKGEHPKPPPPSPEEVQTYWLSLSKIMAQLKCPVVRCQGETTNRTNLRVHFVHHHVKDTIVILEEGNRPLLCG